MIQSTRGGSILESVDTKSLTDNILNTSERYFVNVGGDIIRGSLNFTENALINMNYNRIINMGKGISDEDAVNKKQLEDYVEKSFISKSTFLVFKQQVATVIEKQIQTINTKLSNNVFYYENAYKAGLISFKEYKNQKWLNESGLSHFTKEKENELKQHSLSISLKANNIITPNNHAKIIYQNDEYNSKLSQKIYYRYSYWKQYSVEIINKSISFIENITENNIGHKGHYTFEEEFTGDFSFIFVIQYISGSGSCIMTFMTYIIFSDIFDKRNRLIDYFY